MNNEELRKEAAEKKYPMLKTMPNSAKITVANQRAAFKEGAEWEAERGKSVPYQCCPICNGLGKVLAPNCTSSIYVTCDVCKGAKIIPMYTPTKNK